MFPKDLKHFKSNEFHEPDFMSHDLLYRIDALREYMGTKIVITASTGKVHSENSQHYLGKAVDIVFPDWKGSLISLFFIIERFGFNGIGIYPKWQLNGKKIGGFHVDVRDLTDFQSKRWIGMSKFDEVKKKTVTSYLPFTMIHLMNTGLIPKKQ